MTATGGSAASSPAAADAGIPPRTAATDTAAAMPSCTAGVRRDAAERGTRRSESSASASMRRSRHVVMRPPRVRGPTQCARIRRASSAASRICALLRRAESVSPGTTLVGDTRRRTGRTARSSGPRRSRAQSGKPPKTEIGAAGVDPHLDWRLFRHATPAHGGVSYRLPGIRSGLPAITDSSLRDSVAAGDR